MTLATTEIENAGMTTGLPAGYEYSDEWYSGRKIIRNNEIVMTEWGIRVYSEVNYDRLPKASEVRRIDFEFLPYAFHYAGGDRPGYKVIKMAKNEETGTNFVERNTYSSWEGTAGCFMNTTGIFDVAGIKGAGERLPPFDIEGALKFLEDSNWHIRRYLFDYNARAPFNPGARAFRFRPYPVRKREEILKIREVIQNYRAACFAKNEIPFKGAGNKTEFGDFDLRYDLPDCPPRTMGF